MGLILLFIGSSSFAQKAATSAFVEAGGPGLASFNFDTRFAARQDGWGLRLGLGGFVVDNEGAMFVPVTLNHLLGKDGRNYFEVGGGVTIVPFSSATGNSPLAKTSGHLIFGYRYQPSNAGVLFRATINPVFGNGFFWPFYGGVSVGYKF
ncbi:MAG TPA: hypothetical protein PKE63_00885 [Lacibacter sp.]|nr:hypothetical protein [Lacibacter sp.]